jgi:peptidoglycan hydrolase-like protein with peptidoglycan-binding domain
MAILKRGMAGEPVKRMQEKLGVPADGDFGPGTEKALRDYQQAQGLAVDGLAGPDTFVHMKLYELVLLMNGSTGETVTKVQRELGVTEDGIYGPATAKAVQAFQTKNGIVADGLVGPDTLEKMSGFAEFTPEVVKRSLTTDDKSEAPAASIGKTDAGTAPAPERRSLWSRVKGLFS